MDLNKHARDEDRTYTLLPKECTARYRVTDKQVEEIRARYKQGYTIKSLRLTYRLTYYLVKLIIDPTYIDKQREYSKKKKAL